MLKKEVFTREQFINESIGQRSSDALNAFYLFFAGVLPLTAMPSVARFLPSATSFRKMRMGFFLVGILCLAASANTKKRGNDEKEQSKKYRPLQLRAGYGVRG